MENEKGVAQNRLGNSPLQPYKSYRISGNPTFYNAVPEPTKQYYLHFVREWFYWHDGYVPHLHGTVGRNGVFATQIASTIAEKLSKKITGGRVLFDDKRNEGQTTQKYFNQDLNAIDFIQKWSSKAKLNAKITKAVRWSLAGGDSLIKLDNKDGFLTPKIARKDTYLIDCDHEGNIDKASFLIYDFVHQKQDSSEKVEYYILEERKYNEKTEEPEYRLSIKKGTGQRIAYKDVDFQSADEHFNDLPKGARDKAMRQVPKGFKVGDWNKWKPLPLRDIGVYMLRASEGTSFNPALPFGESVYSNIMHLLAGYDYWYSVFMTDMYLSRGRVMLPRGVDGAVKNEDGYSNYYEGLDDFIYERVPYMAPDEQTPISIQFDPRVDDWSTARDSLLQQMALGIGINPRDLASFIVPAAEKPSAKEISVDEDETSLWVEDKRDLLIPRLNEMIETILDFYNYKEDVVEVKFSQRGLTNKSTLVNQLAIMKQNELIDDEKALDILWADESQSEKDDMLKNIQEKRDKNREQFNTNTVETEEEKETTKETGNQIPKGDENEE